MTSPRPSRPLSGAVLAAVALFGAAAPAAGQENRAQYEESVVVREVELRFDLSVLPTFQSIGKKDAADFRVLEGGVQRPTLRFEAEPEAGDWRILVWVDERLVHGAGRAAALRELAGRAARLVAAGPVELVEAGDSPRRAGPFTDAAKLAAALDEASLRGDAAQRFRVSPADAAAGLDRLIVALAERDAPGPRALLLPVSAWEVDASFLDEIAGARRDLTLTTRATPLLQASRALAADGWVTLALSLAREEPAASITERERRAADARYDAATDLGLVPLRDLVRLSSGAVVSHPRVLDRTLQRLFGRARLIFGSPELPAGALSREVRWVGGDGRKLPTPSLVRSGPSPEVAAARARLGLDRPGGAAPSNGRD
jgi:hypothetical protein